MFKTIPVLLSVFIVPAFAGWEISRGSEKRTVETILEVRHATDSIHILCVGSNGEKEWFKGILRIVADPQEEVGKRTLDQKEAELKKAKGEIAKLKAELVSLKKSEPEGKNDGLSQKDAEQGKAKSEIANLSAELDNLKKKEQAGNETLKESRQLEREVDRKPSQETSEKSDNESCEYKLAVIQNGGYLSESDPLVGKFRVHLDSIMRKTGEDRNRIGDLVVLTQNLLKERGVIENLETVIYALDGSLPEELSPGVIKLEEIVAAYVVLRTGGTK